MNVRTLVPGHAEDALEPYRREARAPRDGRPWVLANMVAGLDGSTAVNGRVGVLSSPTDRQLFLDLRSLADLVLVGASTVRNERYGPVRLGDELVARRREAGRPDVPRIAVVSRSLDLDPELPLFTAGGDRRPIVLTGDDAPTEGRRALSDLADVIAVGRSGVDLHTALAHLHDHLGAEVVLCEGGPTLLGSLAAGDLLDELCLTLAPVVGGDPLPVAVMPEGASLRHARLRHVLEDDGHLFLRYRMTSG